MCRMNGIVIAAETEANSTITASGVIECFNSIVEFIQNIGLVIGVLAAAVIVILSIVNIKRQANKFTEEQLSGLKSNGKYIPGIFVELNESKEILRYFLYRKKWKHRIIRRFNYIYNNVYGDILKKGTTEQGLKFHLSPFTKTEDIVKAVGSCVEYHSRFRERKVKLKPEYQESEVLFEIIHYPYSEALEELENESKAAAYDYLVLTGSAGNGKTNLLCSIADLAMKVGQAVVFLNSREIDTDVDTYILNRLNIHKWLIKHKRLYFHFVNAILRLWRKKLFILIDAINENDSDEFGRSIQKFVNGMSAYRQVKIIVSCRNEYFKERFENVISEGVTSPHLVYDLKSGSYPAAAIDRLIERYKKHFRFTGYISDAVKYVICEHLLLLRVFFEVNRDSDAKILSIKKHEIFAEYVNQVRSSCAPNIERILDVIADSMLRSMEFDFIEKDTLKDFSDDEIDKAFDETILLNKKLILFKDTIARREKEVVYFVFDEIRDYYLARRIMQTHTEAGIDGDAIIRQIHAIRDAKASSEEGIIHYTYVFFRTTSDLDEDSREKYCKQILDFYRIKEGYRSAYYHRHRREQFMNYGLKILFTMGLPLTGYEIEYIQDCLRKAPNEDGGKIFDVALEGTRVGLEMDLDFYFDILFGLKDKDAVFHAYKAMAVNAELAGVHLPYDLIPLHKYLFDNYPERAEQVQKAAELFMIMFRVNDPEREYELQDYFDEISNHTKVQNDMRSRLLQAIGEK